MVSSVSAVMSRTTSTSSSKFRRSHLVTSCPAMSSIIGW
ncbi:Uncharacterised protein [Mycobacterium tuberculosis]|nr:Uncharacterised protein [Mycobacterium tuberculosis]